VTEDAAARSRPGGPGGPGGRPWAVAQHSPDDGPGLLAGAFDDAGLAVTVVRLDRGDALPPPTELAGVAVMGGAMGVHDTDDHPWLVAERAWLADAVAAAVPVLGVCLGAQQLAAALGAEVVTGPAPEIGVGSVELSAEGRRDPVLGPEGRRLAVVHWHGDTFALLPGAVRLATNDRYQNQAFRLGRAVYGLQFHLEVDDAMARVWAPDLPAGVTLAAPGRRAVAAVGRRVFRRFLGVAAGR